MFFPTAATLDEPGYLRTSDVRALADAGMEIGTHGMQHRSWRDMSAEQAQDELVAARERLEDAAGHRIDTAACPFGAYDRGALKQLRRAGYAHVMTSDGGHTSPASWLQPRNTLRRTHDLATVVRHLLHESPSRWQRLTRSGRLLLKRWR